MKDTKNILGTSLNAQQAEAVRHSEGALLVIAGAGSGKTRVITTRIAHLMLSQQVDPRRILALTFTNKAATEMKERLTTYLGNESILPYVGTFHAYCLYLLRRSGNYRAHTLIDGSDQMALFKELIKKYSCEKQIAPNDLARYISKHVNDSLDTTTTHSSAPLLEELYGAYREAKKVSQLLDFDDLLTHTYNLFAHDESFRTHHQNTVRHILVDEYQDTNTLQHALLAHMSISSHKKLAIDSVCAVGDEDQSIYSWRGAKVKNIAAFKDEFAPVTLIKIEQNYRSVSPILDAANALISHNSMRTPKALWSARQAKNRVAILHARSEYQEAQAILAILASLPPQKCRDMAILYRTHYQSRLIEEALIGRGIPYAIVGGLAFYARKEIKDVIAYLRLIVNPRDRVSLIRVLNSPTRGLGPACLDIINRAWEQAPELDFIALMQRLIAENHGPFTGKKAATLRAFIAIFDGLSAQDRPQDALQTSLSRTNYIDFLRGGKDAKDAQERIENLQELIRSVEQFQQYGRTGPSTTNDTAITVDSFLQSVSLLQETMQSKTTNNQPVIQIMTMHAAKGLEFDTVCICGLEEGIFPSSRNLDIDALLEEERRLFYVGMTRAKEHLILLHSQFRTMYGTALAQEPSRFLREIPSELVHTIDVRHSTLAQTQQHCASWLSSRPTQQSPYHPATRAYDRPQKKQRVTTPTAWRPNQVVLHATFGIGRIVGVEKRNDGNWSITAQFRNGKKKVLSRFLKRI